MHFTAYSRYGKFGSWDAVEHLDAQSKHNALMNFIIANPCWWTGCTD